MLEEKIVDLLQEQNNLLVAILEELQEGLHLKREGNDKKYAFRTPLGQDDFDGLDDEIDLDWWFTSFGEEERPAKYMNQTGEQYSKQEKDYLFRRLTEIASVKPEVNGGTHVFTYVGKKYSKAEKNAVNCFACVPAK